MRRTRLVVALVLAVVGAVWLGQGSGVIGGSMMSGSSLWAVVGLVLVVIAGVIVANELRRRATRRDG